MRLVSTQVAEEEFPDLLRLRYNNHGYIREDAFGHGALVGLPKDVGKKNLFARWLVTTFLLGGIAPDSFSPNADVAGKCRVCVVLTDIVFSDLANMSAFDGLLKHYSRDDLDPSRIWDEPCLIFDESEHRPCEAIVGMCVTNMFDFTMTTSTGGLVVQLNHHENLWVGSDDPVIAGQIVEGFGPPW